MAFEFKLPDLGEGLTEGEIVKWLVKVGDAIEEGQVFVQVETDKAVIEIPSPRKGVVIKLGASEGETVLVGRVILTLGEKGEALPKVSPGKEETFEKRPSVGVVGELEEAPPDEEPPPPKAGKEAKPAAAPAPAGEILAVPMVRKLAADLKVDLHAVQGSGPQGRITKEDVMKAARAPQGQAPEGEAAKTPPEAPKAARKYDIYGYIERIPLKGMRKTIAQAMVKSKTTIPHAVSMDEADITQLVALKSKAKERAAAKGVHLTFLPFMMKVVVAALEEHPALNATLDDEAGEIILKKYYNIGLAVDTKDGLMVPVVKSVKGKNIFQLAAELAEVSDKARARTIDLADLKGGTFTITNYGAIGGIYGFPIIHHPEVAILGMGRILEKPLVVKGQIEVRKVLPLSLSFDHRVVDGAEAARFLNTVLQYLEEPDLLILEI
jgi:pyruvate dehydrogenase E2 component (dihydrolipoamide acetyltransferase)